MKKIQLKSKNYINLFHYDNEVRPLVLIAPGGAYLHTSWREGLPVAKVVQKYGFHVGIIYYREELLMYPKTVEELANFVKYIRENSKELLVDEKRIYLMGFSSGGHYVATLGVDYMNYGKEAKPNALVLAYPVLTGKTENAHELSIKQMFGVVNEETRRKFSVEERVSKDTPRTFIFHTVEDQAVNVKHSLLYFNKLLEYGIKAEMHLYQKGKHGISICTKEVPLPGYDPVQFEEEHKEQANWIHQAMKWLMNIDK